MRKVRHRNVVQFIGACTKRPNLCIVFEFMTGGSVYDHLRQARGPRRGALPAAPLAAPLCCFRGSSQHGHLPVQAAGSCRPLGLRVRAAAPTDELTAAADCRAGRSSWPRP